MIERLSTDRGLFLLAAALLVAATALVVVLGYYEDVLRALWNLV